MEVEVNEVPQQAENSLEREDLFSDGSDVEDKDLFGSSSDDEVEDEPEKVALELTLPKGQPVMAAEDAVYMAKMPNFLHVDPKPFNPDTFDEEDNEDDQRIKLRVENTIRWRFLPGESGADGRKESNARIVRWSDGTMSLVVGNETFDIQEKSLQFQHQYLFLRHVEGNMLQAETKLDSSIAFRPTSTASQTHKKLTATVLAKHQKVNKTKFIGTIANPEKAKQEMEKAEVEKLKLRKKQQRKQQSAYEDELTAEGLEEEEYGDVPDEEYDKDFVVDDTFVEMDDDEQMDDVSDPPTEEESEEEEQERRVLQAKKSGDTSAPEKRKRVILSDDESD